MSTSGNGPYGQTVPCHERKDNRTISLLCWRGSYILLERKTLFTNLAPGKPRGQTLLQLQRSAYFRNRLFTTSPVPISQTGVALAVPRPMVHRTDSCREPS